MINAVSYARYSSDNQREESIDAQLRAIKEYAVRNGYVIVREYTDEARSATTDRRPAFQEMISDSVNHEWEAVLVHKLDRFSRDRYDSAMYRRVLKKNGVKLISVLENLDGSPESIILESVLEGMAEYYSRNLAREVMKGMNETAYQCKHTGGIPPLGYSVNADKTYSIVPDEADTVQTIFRMYADGKGYSDILCALKDKHTKLGHAFAKNSLSSILRNEKYTGTFVFNRTERKTAGKRNNHKSKSDDEIIRIRDGMPRIIDDETWRRAQARLSDNTRNASNKAKVCYLLSGKLVCSKCGSVFVGKTKPAGRNSAPYRYYMCGSRDRRTGCDMRTISAAVIEPAVIDWVEQIVDVDIEATIDVIGAELDKYLATLPSVARDADDELREIAAKKKRIVIAVRDGAPYSMFAEEVGKLEQREAVLEEEKKKAKIPAGISRDVLRGKLLNASNIRSKTPEEQKRVIATLIDRIVVYDDRFEFECGGLMQCTEYRTDGGGGES